jgi:hypothetical protein
MSQKPRVPNLEAQRAAMNKLSFLVGEWSGEAHILSGPGAPLELVQTETAQYKLDGLILMIEGVGRTKSAGQPILQALGIISYDDDRRAYSMRAFNDGRFLETVLNLSEDARTVTWGFAFGEIRTSSAMHINDQGEWAELHEITIGSQPSKKFMEMAVRRQR